MERSFNTSIELQKYKERFSAVLQAAKICVYEVDIKNQLYTFFENAEVIFHKSGKTILEEVWKFSKLQPEEYQKQVMAYFAHPDDVAIINEAFQNIFEGKPFSYQARMKAGDTEFVWCKIDVTPIVENGETVYMVGVITDINAMKLQMDGYRAMAKLDPLTGLFNKTATECKIARKLSENNNETHALVLIDIDSFKAVNDTYGHSKGDEVLKEFSDELKRKVRKTDILGRWGGDEFVLLLCNIGNADNLHAKLKEMLAEMNLNFGITQSIGAAIYPGHAQSFKELFIKADTSLYKAKNQKNTYCVYQEL